MANTLEKKIGGRIRKLREGKRMTLANVPKSTGLPKPPPQQNRKCMDISFLGFESPLRYLYAFASCWQLRRHHKLRRKHQQ
jgi:hypothetical protein